MRQSQGESIWGNINLSIEIALNVYQIYAEHGKGIMVKANEKHNLSDSTLQQGVKDSEGNVYFDEETQKIPMLEILNNREVQAKAIIAAIEKQRQELIKGDNLLNFNLIDFIGTLEPPDFVKEEVRNGVYFTEENGEAGFAVHKAIVDNMISSYAVDFGVQNGEYLYFDMEHLAIPLAELRDKFPEVEALVISEDSLYATLNEKFPFYVKQVNEICADEVKIPNVTSAVNLFLATQLKNEREHLSIDHDTEDNEYGEDVDYSFEQ